MHSKEQKRPRIAVIGSKGLPSRISGLEVYVQAICTELANDYDITVFCRKRYCDEVVKEYQGVRVIHVPSINTKHLDAMTYTLFATVKALGGEFDLFWYHALGPAITAYLPKLVGKRILSTVHGLDWKRAKFGRLASGVLKFGERAIAKCADEIIVLNAGDRDHFRERWGRDTHLVRNGVVVQKRVAMGDWSERIGADSSEYILFASRIVPEKNLHVLIAAYEKLDTNKKLVIAGSGVHTDGYVEQVHELARGNDNIVFVGHVGKEDLAVLYSNAYCYVLPSTVEGQSIGLLEAMSYGLPCIVSDIPENREVARGSSMYFIPGDEEDLRQKLAKMLDEAFDTKKAGEEALSIVKEEHGIADTVSKTRRLIDKCIEPSKHGKGGCGAESPWLSAGRCIRTLSSNACPIGPRNEIG